MRGTLALILLALFSATMVALFKYALPDGNREILTYMAGQMSGMAGTALAYYFSTTQSSHEKTAMLAGKNEE